MSKQLIFNSAQTHMLDARILAFHIGTDGDEYIAPEEVDVIGFRVESEEFVDIEQQHIRIILNFWLDAYLSSEHKEEADKSVEYQGMGFCRIGFLFFMENFDELISPIEAEEVQVDAEAMIHLFAMAYSTSRGIILEKTRGTSLEGSLLPIIDPLTLIER